MQKENEKFDIKKKNQKINKIMNKNFLNYIPKITTLHH